MWRPERVGEAEKKLKLLLTDLEDQILARHIFEACDDWAVLIEERGYDAGWDDHREAVQRGEA
jgi:hypothetical protein